MKNRSTLFAAAGIAALCIGCIHTRNEVDIKPIEVKPVEIKPIQISLDVKIKVEDALNHAANTAGTDPALAAAFDRLRSRRETFAIYQEEGSIGVTNQGTLVNRLAPEDRNYRVVQLLVEAENRDRTEIVDLIASKRQLSVEEIRAGWAARAAEKAEPGAWLEDAEGNWYQKK